MVTWLWALKKKSTHLLGFEIGSLTWVSAFGMLSKIHKTNCSKLEHQTKNSCSCCRVS